MIDARADQGPHAPCGARAGTMQVLAAEDLGDRGVLEHGVDGVGDELGTDSTSSLSKRRSWGIGRVLSRPPCEGRILQAVDGRSDRTAWVAMHHTWTPPVGQQVGGGHDGACGVDHVVDEHALAALDVATT